MNCKNCGVQLADDNRFCPNCGVPVERSAPSSGSGDYYSNPNFRPDSAGGAPYGAAGGYRPAPQPQANHNDTGAAGFGILGFFFPIVGLILYLVWKDEMPLRAKASGKGALIGVILYVAVIVLVVILYVVLIINYVPYMSIELLPTML